MAKSFEFFFDFVSPTAYLAFHEAQRVAERTGAEIVWRPMLLGGVMQATGNKPPGLLPARGAYMAQDLPRCARHLGVSFAFNPHFPFMALGLLRAAIGLGGQPETRLALISAAFRHAWGIETPEDLGNKAVQTAIAEEAGLDPARFEALASDPANKAALKANTQEAVKRGAFGAPTFFIGEDMFFGHDRLDYVERALAA